MLKVVNVPLTVIPSEIEISTNDAWGHLGKRKEKYAQVEADALKELDEALNEGYTIANTHEFTAERATWLRYTLHKRVTVGTTSMSSEKYEPHPSLNDAEIAALAELLKLPMTVADSDYPLILPLLEDKELAWRDKNNYYHISGMGEIRYKEAMGNEQQT